jgi:hypothetical protein
MICAMNVKATTALMFALILGGCSSSYDLRATIIDGKIAFVSEGKDFWGNPEPDCFYSISVQIVDGPPATPAPGESVGTVRNGTYWNRTFAVTSCDNPFPVTYGAELQGPPFRENYQYEVDAKPLLKGFTYEVSASSKGSAYGARRFMLTKQGTIKNLPR